MSATPPSLPFAIEEIERELARLWQSAPGIDRRHELALSRTSVLTLFVYAPDRARAAWVRQVISRLSIYHPSRVVLFVTSHDQPLEEPEISIQCDLGIAERYAPCYEQVTITLPSDGLELLPSLVIPLALPDLPAVLWWLGPLPCQDRRFVRVARAVDRLIFDSLEQSQPLRDLVSTRRLVQQVSRTTVVSDLNWSRLSPWQETTARIFDIPHCRWALTAIERVDLRFGVASEQPSRNPIQVLLYLGWLANRLAWRLDGVQVRATGWELTFSSPRNTISVTVSPFNSRLVVVMSQPRSRSSSVGTSGRPSACEPTKERSASFSRRSTTTCSISSDCSAASSRR